MSDYENYRNLANAIIFQAIRDYQKGSNGRKSEVMRFLKSNYCDILLPDGVTGDDIRSRIKNIRLEGVEV